MERNLFVNEVLKMDEQLYRVLWISPDRQYGYWISLGSEGRLPERFEYDRLLQAIQDGQAETAEDPVKAFDGEVPEGAKQKRDEWWEMLRPVLEREPEIYDRQKRGRMLSELSARHNRDKANLYRYLQKYWKRGKTPNAFLQDFRNCGKGPKAQKDHKLGRPVVHEGGFGKILTDGDKKHFEAAINKIGRAHV